MIARRVQPARHRSHRQRRRPETPDHQVHPGPTGRGLAAAGQPPLSPRGLGGLEAGLCASHSTALPGVDVAAEPTGALNAQRSAGTTDRISLAVRDGRSWGAPPASSGAAAPNCAEPSRSSRGQTWLLKLARGRQLAVPSGQHVYCMYDNRTQRRSVVTELNKQAIREHIIESLSWVRDAGRTSLDREIDEQVATCGSTPRRARLSASSSRMPWA